jgi:hypothetical protein
MLAHHGLADGARDPRTDGWSHYLARASEPDPWIVDN